MTASVVLSRRLADCAKSAARWSIAAVFAAAGIAAAPPYPSKPSRMIIPAPAGGGVDTVGRVIGQRLSEALGQPVIMDNRPGAGTMIGSELTAKAPADGYTVLMVTNSHAINASLHRKLAYDPVADFAPVTLAAISPYLLVVHPSVPAQSVKGLIALAKQRPGQLYYASAGTGTATHLAGELFRSMAHIDMVHVPYKGGTPAVTDLVGGQVQLMFNNIIGVAPMVSAHRLRALAVTSEKRLAAFSQLATVAESGLPGYGAGAWYGVLVPARTPASVIAVLHRAIVEILKLSDVREKLAAEGAPPVGSTPEAFAAAMKNEIRKWTDLVAKLGMRID